MTKPITDKEYKTKIMRLTLSGALNKLPFWSLLNNTPRLGESNIQIRDRRTRNDDAERAVIEYFAEISEGVKRVASGESTFLSYGQPIIENALETAENYRDRRFKCLSAKVIMGADSEQSREAIRYLVQEGIINPYKHFHSTIYSTILYPREDIQKGITRQAENFRARLKSLDFVVGRYSSGEGKKKIM